MPSEKKERLPFEPKAKKKPAKVATPTPTATVKESGEKAAKGRKSSPETSLKAIPEAVTKRMARRMALFCGIPTGLGMSSFFLFYWVISNKIIDIPPYAAQITSLGLFGLGFVGLSYGIFSASWDEDRVGSWLGWKEFQGNFKRTIAAWKSGQKTANNQE